MPVTINGFYESLNRSGIARPRRKNAGAKDARTTRFIDPYDNLLYAILLQAAIDSKGDKWGVHCQGDAMKFLQSETARDWWEYLNTRPKYE